MRPFHVLPVLIALFLALAPDARSGVFNPETFTLDNGLQVVVVTNRRAPVVTHMLWYRVGRADESPGKGGLSHLLEHLMFKGSEAYPDGEMSRRVARNGGRENAFTSYDYTAYHQTVARDRLGLMMAMEADRMTNLRLGAPVVEPERQVVLEERRMRIGNVPAARLRAAARAALFVNHPYGQPIIGWTAEIEGYGLEDILAHYRRWYCPANAVLVIAGDVTAAEARPLVERHYGPLACAAPPPARVRPPIPDLESERRVTLRDPNVGQPTWRRVWLAPSHGTADPPAVAALEVLDEVLSGGATSRLHRALVVDRGVATSVHTHYNPDALDKTDFTVFAAPRPGVPIERLEDAAVAEIGALLRDGVTDSEVARAKQRLLDSAVYARESIRVAARVFGVALTTGQTVDDVESWPDRIASVTAGEVARAARAVLGRPGHVTSILLPETATGS